MKEHRNYRLKVQMNGYSILVTEDTLYDLCVSTNSQLKVLNSIIGEEPVLNIFFSFKTMTDLKITYKSSKWFPSDLDTSIDSAFNQCVKSLDVKELLPICKELFNKRKAITTVIDIVSLVLPNGLAFGNACKPEELKDYLKTLIDIHSGELDYKSVLNIRRIQKEELQDSCILYSSDECISIPLRYLTSNLSDTENLISELFKFSFIGGDSND